MVNSQRYTFLIFSIGYLIGVVFIFALGAAMVFSGIEGFQWYSSGPGHLLPLPSPDVFRGIGLSLMVLAVVLFIAGTIERFFCPSCPFPFAKNWESPSVSDNHQESGKT